MRNKGVLSSQAITGMLARGEISSYLPHVVDQVQPASLDLRLGQKRGGCAPLSYPGLTAQY